MKKCIIDIETSDYLPWTDSTIICIGIMNLTTRTKHVFHNDNEQDLIRSFTDYFNQRDFTEVIGYNITFDIRFLLSRCLRYQIPAQQLYNAKTTDLLKILSLQTQSDNYNKPGKLGEWSTYLFNKNTLYQNGSIRQLYQQNMIQDIIAHNHRDLELTHQLYQRIIETIGEETC